MTSFLDADRRLAVFGSGGKTTLIEGLARRWAAAGERVLVTTTTKVRELPGVETVTDPAALAGVFERGRIVLLVSERDGRGKLHGFLPERMEEFAGLADRLLVEADGARQRSLKVHLPHDPVLPEGMPAIMVLGASVPGRPAGADTVHRLERAPEHWGLRAGEVITAETVARVALVPDGYLGKVRGNPLTLLVNQADEFPREAAALAGALRRLWPGRIFTGSARELSFEALTDPASRPGLVLLAAGGGARWPGPKLRERLAGRSVLEWSLAAWRNARLMDRLAVLAPGDEQGAAEALRAGFRPVICEDAHLGQSQSLRAGLAALSPDCTGAVFALGDMPALAPASAAALLAAVEEAPARAIRPSVGGRPGHPVHLPCSSFTQLEALEGDRGPRELLPALGAILLDLDDPGAILDLDEPADAARLESILKARRT